MKTIRVTKNHIAMGNMIAYILITYDEENVREADVPFLLMKEVIPGNENLLLHHPRWTQYPEDYRRAIAEVVTNIEGLAARWHQGTGINYISNMDEIVGYIADCLAKGVPVTIDYSEGYSPTATLRAKGEEDTTIYFGSLMLALTALGLSGELGGLPEDIFPIYLTN